MAIPRLCSIEECGKNVIAVGLCEAHYRKKRRYGDPCVPDMRYRPDRECSVEGCGRSAHRKAGGKRGWCQKHYDRWWHHGDPTITRKTPDGVLETWLMEHIDHKGDECLIWPFGKGPKGYAGSATIAGVNDYAHRHMCRLVHGPAPSPKHEVAHSCGRGLDACINPTHVRWDTHIGNMADQLVHQTRCRGSSVRVSRLKEADIPEIRAMAKLGHMHKTIAAKFGVHPATIGAVVNGKSWSWLRS